MKKNNAKQIFVFLLAIALLLIGGIFFSLPRGAQAQAVTDTPTATATATLTATATATATGTQTITGTVTATVTGTKTITGTVTPGTPTRTATFGFSFATRTPTARVLVPSTGGDLRRPSILGEVDGTGTFVAVWLVGLLLVGYSLWARKSKQ